jgi:ribosomal protein S26
MIISVTLFSFAMLFMIAFIDRKNVQHNTYQDVYGVIVEIRSSEDPKILIRDLSDSTMFAEWSITKESYNKYKLGDTVHFDLINKSRYFKIESIR